MHKKIASIFFHFFLYFFTLIGMLFTFVFFGMQMNLFSVKGSITERNSFFQKKELGTKDKEKNTAEEYFCTDGTKVCDIFLTPEWTTVEYGLEKDKDVLMRVSNETQVPIRLLVSLAVPEQLRFFSAERETYKKYFEPLKILGTMSQFSLGVTGIKPQTAKEIEEHLISTSSPYYLGKDYENLLDYQEGEDKEKTQYTRLTDAKNHYYSYLYTALFIKQIEVSWKKSGFPLLEKDGGIYATLFNLGFTKSVPNPNPKLGGAIIKVGGKTYTYGEAAEMFLLSDKLLQEFPKK